MVKKIIIFVLILLGCFTGGLLWIINDPRPLSNMVRWSVERAIPGVRFSELKIAKQNFFWPARVVFENVSCRAQIAGHSLAVKAKTLEFSKFVSLPSLKRSVNCYLSGGEVDFEPGKARGLTAQLEISVSNKGATVVAGPLTVEALMWDKIKAGKTSCQLKSDVKSVELSDVRSEAYGGTITGMAHMIIKSLSYAVDINFDRLQTSRLAEFNEQISAQMAGRISGIVHVTGNALRPTLIDADLKMPSGGKVNAALLSALTQYLPKSQERARLDVLIKNGGKLAVEVFSFTIKSNTPDHLSGLIKLASKDANIELNLTHDILTDGTWDGLVQYWQTIFK
ncbi:MAG: hypothetical protein HQL21_00795 [Candidatus Omnitrophica bacterium]|nr:hypothetical protein [Candidatus Omnitrophota bacterium]